MLRICLVMSLLGAGCVSAQRGDLPAQRWPKNRIKRDEEMSGLRDVVKDLELRVITLERRIRELRPQAEPSPAQRVE